MLRLRPASSPEPRYFFWSSDSECEYGRVDHRVDQARAGAGPHARDRVRTLAAHLEVVAAVDLHDVEAADAAHHLRDRRGRLVGRPHRDRVAVVGDDVEHREVEPARGVERLPELAFGRRALAERHVRDLVAVRDAARQLRPPADVARGLGAADRGQALAARARRLRHDVQLARAPVARHLPAAGRGIGRRADRLQQHLERRDAEREDERAVAVVGEEPVVAGPEVPGEPEQQASWPAPEIWKNARFCCRSAISRSSRNREMCASRRSSTASPRSISPWRSSMRNARTPSSPIRAPLRRICGRGYGLPSVAQCRTLPTMPKSALAATADAARRSVRFARGAPGRGRPGDRRHRGARHRRERARHPRRRARAAPSGPLGDEIVPFNNVRKRAAKLLVASKQTSAHTLCVVAADYSAIEAVRRERRNAWREEEGFSLTYLPFVARAVVDALREFPLVERERRRRCARRAPCRQPRHRGRPRLRGSRRAGHP